jgi:hypothetical protein
MYEYMNYAAKITLIMYSEDVGIYVFDPRARARLKKSRLSH